jgi:hypothetical protein
MNRGTYTIVGSTDEGKKKLINNNTSYLGRIIFVMKRFFFCCLIILVFFLEGGNSTTIIATLVSSRVLFALDKMIIKDLCNISSLVLLSFFCTLSTLGRGEEGRI